MHEDVRNVVFASNKDNAKYSVSVDYGQNLCNTFQSSNQFYGNNDNCELVRPQSHITDVPKNLPPYSSTNCLFDNPLQKDYENSLSICVILQNFED